MSRTLRRALWVGLVWLSWQTAACDLNPQPALPTSEGTSSGGKASGNQGGTGLNLGGGIDLPSSGAATGGTSSSSGGVGPVASGGEAAESGGGASGGDAGSGGEASGGDATGGVGGDGALGAGTHG